MRLIDADKVKIDSRKHCIDCKMNGTKHCKTCVINLICDRMDLQPTVEERPHGKWICEDVLHCLYYCSECRNNGEHIQPFCAWCGADMRGDKNG